MSAAQSGVRIRTAAAADADALWALVCALEDTAFDRAAFAERLAAQLADERYTCLVAEDGDRILGMLNLRIEVQLHHERPAAEIMELVVDESARAHGLGARLVEEARACARAAGCEVYEVTSSFYRTRAHRFYERAGLSKTHYRLSQSLPL